MVLLPERPGKPRLAGMTQVLDRGIDLPRLEGLVADHAPLIDLLKFGWGTALVTPRIAAKIALCRQHGITPVLGGTLFEYCVLTDQYRAFCRLLDELELTTVEVSNGAQRIEPQRICTFVRELAQERRVLNEIGSKSPQESAAMSLEEWSAQIENGLEAGASMIILEARESGQSGFCTPEGQPRPDFCQTFLERFGAERLMFEAPTSKLQATLIKTHGHLLNLANIHPDDVVSLETLRLGLRFDTLAQFPLACPRLLHDSQA
jgi:phosphosulfolactate synthase